MVKSNCTSPLSRMNLSSAARLVYGVSPAFAWKDPDPVVDDGCHAINCTKVTGDGRGLKASPQIPAVYNQPEEKRNVH